MTTIPFEASLLSFPFAIDGLVPEAVATLDGGHTRQLTGGDLP